MVKIFKRNKKMSSFPDQKNNLSRSNGKSEFLKVTSRICHFSFLSMLKHGSNRKNQWEKYLYTELLTFRQLIFFPLFFLLGNVTKLIHMFERLMNNHPKKKERKHFSDTKNGTEIFLFSS